MDLSTSSIDGSHTKTLREGEEARFQTRKMCKTTNSLYLTDNQGLPIAISSTVSGNHHDLYEIEEQLNELFLSLRNANINTDGLFVNADAVFDSRKFRNKCSEYGIIANTALNPRNGTENEFVLFDDELYEQSIRLKEQMRGWIVTERYSIDLAQP